MKFFLIGFMAAGKTTIGRLLAEKLGIPFYDLDQLIEASQGCTVREIFERAGEAEFRRIERDLLLKTRFLSDAVIATGGGTFTFEENVFFIKSEGTSIHLDVPFEVVKRRIGDKASTRPLFRDDESTLKLYQYRAKYYKMADRVVEISDNDPPESVVDRILRGIHHDDSRPV